MKKTVLTFGLIAGLIISVLMGAQSKGANASCAKRHFEFLCALWCAPKGAITSWVKVPPGQWSVGPVAGRRCGWVTRRIEALRQRPPWAVERIDGP